MAKVRTNIQVDLDAGDLAGLESDKALLDRVVQDLKDAVKAGKPLITVYQDQCPAYVKELGNNPQGT